MTKIEDLELVEDGPMVCVACYCEDLHPISEIRGDGVEVDGYMCNNCMYAVRTQ